MSCSITQRNRTTSIIILSKPFGRACRWCSWQAACSTIWAGSVCPDAANRSPRPRIKFAGSSRAIGSSSTKFVRRKRGCSSLCGPRRVDPPGSRASAGFFPNWEAFRTAGRIAVVPRRKRIAVILPVQYRGGTLGAAKQLAIALWEGSRRNGEDVDVIFAHIDDPQSIPHQVPFRGPTTGNRQTTVYVVAPERAGLRDAR